MFFNNGLFLGAFAMTAAALPHVQQRDATPSSTSSPSASPSSGGGGGGGGGVQIVNNMEQDVNLWTTDDSAGDQQHLSGGGGTHEQKFQTNSNGGGISIKMSTTDGKDSVLQFEYTGDGDQVFYDLSSIDMDPESAFVKSGFSVQPDDSSCEPSTCEPGDANCKETYQKPDDDHNTKACSSGATFVVTLG
ncbi:hypothetical protein P168DRAFT_289514 [Aspergillus campestris IBT 28561]|uniref:GPI anchored cell wall protein n=1 Tax=Aspergillus campestris (strain IBT 28561) TaxID=1392248 RepID=A0A2I1D400_ASPC2|nr:uncharacterized protein P168DRAFT_289514 [Aspergillus campestris IBT 28561]PKY04596.1 hypothetical protein P168DRAFT_289514 [Aspergillus campestris IBT 28561]